MSAIGRWRSGRYVERWWIADVDGPGAYPTIHCMKAAALFLFVALAACTRSPPVLLQRSLSPDQLSEITLWREEAEGTLDSNTYLTISEPGAPFNAKSIFARIKRGSDIESYWSTSGKPVLSIRDFYGFVASKNGTASFVICGLSVSFCRRLLPPSATSRVIKLGTYHTGESEPFAD